MLQSGTNGASASAEELGRCESDLRLVESLLAVLSARLTGASAPDSWHSLAQRAFDQSLAELGDRVSRSRGDVAHALALVHRVVEEQGRRLW